MTHSMEWMFIPDERETSDVYGIGGREAGNVDVSDYQGQNCSGSGRNCRQSRFGLTEW